MSHRRTQDRHPRKRNNNHASTTWTYPHLRLMMVFLKHFKRKDARNNILGLEGQRIIITEAPVLNVGSIHGQRIIIVSLILISS